MATSLIGFALGSLAVSSVAWFFGHRAIAAFSFVAAMAAGVLLYGGGQ